MSEITYCLKGDKSSSDEFYRVLENFTRRTEDFVYDHSKNILNDMKKNHPENESIPQLVLDYITMGLLWDRYIYAAVKSNSIAVKLSTKLYKIRKNYPKVKNLADSIRGRISGIFLIPNIKHGNKEYDKSIYNFNRLIKWLSATGEFEVEVKRLLYWFDYLETLSDEKVVLIISKSIEIFEWFKMSAHETLHSYTRSVDKFLSTSYRSYRFREDELFCGKEEVEYHLNMVASEIMNKSLIENFKKSKKKVVLLPGCMSIEQEKCKAEHNGLDITCTGCNRECRINQIQDILDKEGVKLFIVPHSSSFTKWLDHWKNVKDTSVVASACILNIAVGGYQMMEREIPSQCVLLDICGCKKHWDKKGIPTDLNVSRLLEILD